MNLLDVYQNVLIELEKQKAPSMLIDEFNYLYQKSVIQFLNTNYNFTDMNQQEDDNLSAFNNHTRYDVLNMEEGKDYFLTIYGVQFNLPEKYFHLKNCVVTFMKEYGQCDSDENIIKGAFRITSDKFPGVINNYYNKPSWKKPYYYLSNNNKIEIRYGNDTKHILKYVDIDYLKYPESIELTLEDIYDCGSRNKDELDVSNPTDATIIARLNSLELPFPDYVCYEIINIMVKLFLERHKDPRLQTNTTVNQTIATPQV